MIGFREDVFRVKLVLLIATVCGVCAWYYLAQELLYVLDSYKMGSCFRLLQKQNQRNVTPFFILKKDFPKDQ